MDNRLAFLKARALRSYHGEDSETATLRNASLAETEGEPPVIREAKAFAHHCRNRTIVIHDGELVVGAVPSLRYHPTRTTPSGIFGRQPFAPPGGVSENVQTLFRQGLLSYAGNHTTMDYEAIMRGGFSGLIDRIEKRRAAIRDDEPQREEKHHFLDALRIVAEGYIDLCRRYGEHAVRMADECADKERRRELEAIAEHCSHVPASPPRTFHEACQSVWFCFLFLPDAPGRVDQYLYPFYRTDLERGAITPDAAREILGCLWVKYFELAGAQAAVSAHQHLTLGGVRPDGADASNDVTWLCLDVMEDFGLQRPQVGLRWNRNTPPELTRRAVRALRNRTSNPDFCNDEQIVPALIRIGVAPEDARDFSLSGCHEVVVTGKAQMGSVEGFINVPKILRIALGLEPEIGATPELDGIADAAGLDELLREAIESVVEAAHEASVERDRQAAGAPGGGLNASLVVADCIENLRGYTQGGARYNFCNWNLVGVANLADSLVAIRKVVFEENALTLSELVDALQSNWDDREPLRQRMLNRIEHFGNDNLETDAVAARIIEDFSEAFAQRTPFRGGHYILGTLAGGENMHIEFGRLTGATPDGRCDATPLADSIGAAQGRDRHGVTALLNSAARLPHHLLPTATTLNVKLTPDLLKTEEGVGKIATLIETHFRNGGQQCQLNMVSREMLLEARSDPEKGAGLMVRVAGYCAPFNTLWPDLQDEILARSEHAV